MSPLVWLCIPLVAVVLAAVWGGWAGRPRGMADPVESVEAHHRFVEALDRSRRDVADAAQSAPAAGPPSAAGATAAGVSADLPAEPAPPADAGTGSDPAT